ncbi:hypothetical protein AAFF_G00209630 [Aldrovandia affinis]|uniref:Uncharacterized protein n=1 Tax=Aldrovandia affinis TaxID=143900 RepID=A0AAD7SW74_9TELE|nr:hypothetical protein AAFF_G00209630 [Aldrovandia affinis]
MLDGGTLEFVFLPMLAAAATRTAGAHANVNPFSDLRPAGPLLSGTGRAARLSHPPTAYLSTRANARSPPRQPGEGNGAAEITYR